VRSEWRLWTDPRRIEWPVPGGTAFVVSQMFGGDRIDNEDGSWTPREFTYVERPDGPTAPYFVMECEYSAEDLIPRVRSLQAIQSDPQREIRSSDLRSISIEDALQAAWLKVTYRPAQVTRTDSSNLVEQLTGPKTPPDPATYRGLRKRNRQKLTQARLREVAAIYTEALPSGSPTKAVKEAFGLAESTASMYVRKARDTGLIAPR